MLSVLKSSKRQLWIATQNSVSHVSEHDDVTYTHFRNITGNLERIRARKILEIWDSQILILTLDDRVLSLNSAKNEFEFAAWLSGNGVSGQNVAEFYFSSNQTLWLAYQDGGLYRLQGRNQSSQSTESGISSTPSDIFGLPNGGALISSIGGELIETSSTGRVIENFDFQEACDEAGSISEVAKTSNGDVWIGTNGGGIYIVDSESGNCGPLTIDQYPTVDSRPTRVNDIQIVPPGHSVLVGTDAGLLLCTSAGGYCDSPYHPFSGSISEVISINVDSDESGYWIGAYNGLFRLVGSQFRLFDKHVHPFLESIVGFSKAPHDQVLIASYDGLGLFNLNTERTKKIGETYPPLRRERKGLMTLYGDEKKIFVGYRNGGFERISFDELSFRHWDISNTKGMPSNSVSSFLQTELDASIVGTYDKGAWFIGANGEFLPASNFGSGIDHEFDRILMMFQSSDGTVWFGTEGGLKTIDLSDGSTKDIILESSVGGTSIKPVIWTATESEDYIWFGSMHDGLFKTKLSKSFGSSTRVIKHDAAEFSNLDKAVYSIEAGDKGDIWFSTNIGISKRDRSGKIVQYGEASGVTDIGFEFNSSFKDHKGFLYFGGERGFYRFIPSQVGRGPKVSPVFLNNLNVNGKSYDFNFSNSEVKEITLDHNDRFITFNFSTRDLTNTDSTRYQHKLEGFDSDWMDIGNRGSATYTNLPAGSYTFRAQALNSSGVWNTDGIAMNMVVKPAPWLTWWAFILYALLFLGIVYLGLRLFRERTLRKQAMQQAQEMQRVADQFADDLQDQVDFQQVLTDSIHRYNKQLLAWANVCMQRGAEYSLNETEALGAATELRLKVLDLLQDALYYRGEQLYANLNTFVVGLLNMTAHRHPAVNQRLIAVNEVTRELVPAVQAIPLAIIIAELLENSIVHSFLAHNGTCSVRILVRQSRANELELEFQDDGAGIPEGLSFNTAEFAGFAIAAEAASAANGSLEISLDRKAVTGKFVLN